MARLLLAFGVMLGMAAASGAGPAPAQAQDSAPLRGMVWDVPPDEEEALAELRRLHQIGVEAVRTGPVRRDTLLSLADTLGIAFFQELPVAYRGARELQNELPQAADTLDRILQQAQSHPSARHFGLARRSDTSTPAACAYLEALAAHVAENGPSGSQTYYVTTFVEANPCAEAVDLVLLDVRDRDDPLAPLQRWPAADGPPVGIGALGRWVDPEAGSGLRVPHSAEQQARYLETHLRRLFSPEHADALATAPAAVFIYRWRDREVTSGPLRERPYGLHAAGRAGRPARDVVEGFFTGRQTVFAFSAGEAPGEGVSWLVLMGWAVILMLGAFYGTAPRFRRMALRYFSARGFYREAVREGREILTGASLVFLAAIGLSLGILVAVFAQVAYETQAFTVFLQRLAEPEAALAERLMAQPWLLAFTAGSLYAAAVGLWALLLSLVSRRRFPLAIEQTLMLAVWPRWPTLVLMIAAMVLSSWLAEAALRPVAALVGLWFVTTLVAVVRALYDYAALTRISFLTTALLALLSPTFLLGIVLLFLGIEARSEMAFLWHLLTRS